MLTGVSLVEEEPFFSSLDTSPDDEKTKFILGAVDVATRSRITDNLSEWVQTENGMRLVTRASDRNLELIRFGLRGVENFKDAKGNDITVTFITRIQFGKTYQIVDDAFMNYLSPQLMRELADRIWEINTSGNELQKK